MPRSTSIVLRAPPKRLPHFLFASNIEATSCASEYKYMSLSYQAEDGSVKNGKMFKACRMCRKQKLRCEGRNEAPDRGCQRCYVSGVRCIFDVMRPRKRKRPFINDEDEDLTGAHERRDQSRPSPHPIEATNTIETTFHPNIQVPALEFSQDRIHSDLVSPNTTPTGHANPRSRDSEDQATGLTLNDLQAPVSAIHNMFTPSDRADSRTRSSHAKPNSSVSRNNSNFKGSLFDRYQMHDDPISKSNLDQGESRNLFNLFMTSVSNFIPIFDPVKDTFDTMRQSEPFCFTVILALARRIETSGRLLPTIADGGTSLLDDVRTLIADSLFQCPPSLGDVQAMVLLAAYSERTWFAIGHALQMATELDLDKTLDHLQDLESQSALPSNKERRKLVRQARIWLALSFMEREIAVGMARTSRMANIKMEHLRTFVKQPQSRPSDMRLASLVEAVQIRNDFHTDIASATDLVHTVSERLKMMDLRFQEWIAYWDDVYEDYDYDEWSFQRVSIRGQKNYAMIFLGCAILGRLKARQPLSITLQTLTGEQAEIPKQVIATALEQLELVLRADAYKWQLKWATNYTALSLTFTTLFALEISRIRGDLADWQKVLAKASQINDILKQYHSTSFHRLIQLRIDEHSESNNHLESRPIPPDEPWRNHSPHHNDFGDIQVSSEEHHNRANLMPHFSTEVTAPMAQQIGNVDLYQQSQLTNFLDDPSWMTDPSSMLTFDLPDIGNMDHFRISS